MPRPLKLLLLLLVIAFALIGLEHGVRGVGYAAGQLVGLVVYVGGGLLLLCAAVWFVRWCFKP